MENKNGKINSVPNPRAVAELRDRIIWFMAMREMKKLQRFHWVGGCAPFVKA